MDEYNNISLITPNDVPFGLVLDYIPILLNMASLESKNDKNYKMVMANESNDNDGSKRGVRSTRLSSRRNKERENYFDFLVGDCYGKELGKESCDELSKFMTLTRWVKK